MKTQVIQLEPHDDIISTRDKMGWGQTQRVVLVWPHRTRILTRQLDIQLLYRHSRRLGVQIALVTRIPDVRYFAHDYGIPVFATVHQAQTKRWRKIRRGRTIGIPDTASDRGGNGAVPARERIEELKGRAQPPPPPWRSKPSLRLILFAIGVLAVLAIASVLVPSAEIQLKPTSKIQTMTFTALASPAVDSLQLSGVVPAREINVTVEGRRSLPATGEAQIPDTSASGSIRLTNLTAITITVPAGTVIRTLDGDPVRFETTLAGTVPPDPERFINLPVKALTRGSLGNQPAGSLLAIEGPLGLQASVTNPLPTRGGSDIEVPAPADRDRLELRAALLKSLQESAAAEIADLTKAGDLVISPPELVEIIEETFDPPDNQPADSLALLLRVTFSAEVAERRELEELATAILDKSLVDGFYPPEGPIEIDHLTEPLASGGGNTRWQVQAERVVSARMTPNQAINLVLGLPAHTAHERLEENLDLDAPPVIRLFPAWWPRLPILPFRIQVILNPG